MPNLSKSFMLKLAVMLGAATIFLMMFTSAIMKKQMLWKFQYNVYDSDNDIEGLVGDMIYFTESGENLDDFKLMLDGLIERINPNVNRGEPGRRVAHAALLRLRYGKEYDVFDNEEDLLTYDNRTSEAFEAHEEAVDWIEKNRTTLGWDKVEQKIISDDG